MGWFFDGLLLPDRTDADMGFPFDTEEVIPLLQFVLHGKSLYSASLCCGATHTVVDNLIMGAGSRAVLDPEDFSGFYLIDLPWRLLNRRLWQDFQQNGTYRKVTYDADTYVEGDTALDTYRVVVDRPDDRGKLHDDLSQVREYVSDLLQGSTADRGGAPGPLAPDAR